MSSVDTVGKHQTLRKRRFLPGLGESIRTFVKQPKRREVEPISVTEEQWLTVQHHQTDVSRTAQPINISGSGEKSW
eukprot:439647-Pyramimonas_sp.AAC.1